MRPTTLLLLLLLAVVPVTHAADPVLEAKLKEAKLEYVIDGDGDYKIVYEWSQDQRSQVVFISGQPEELEGVRLYSVFSPAKVLDEGEPSTRRWPRACLGKTARTSSAPGSWPAGTCSSPATSRPPPVRPTSPLWWPRWPAPRTTWRSNSRPARTRTE